MSKLSPDIKIIIERNIKLIELNEWDQFFEQLQENWVHMFVRRVVEALEQAGINPLEHMTFIPEGYFYSSPITTFEIPKNINRICFKAFASSDIEQVTIPSNVYDINEGVFEACYSLNTVKFEEGTLYIDHGCFYSCDELKNVTLPKSLVRIGDNVFYRCDNLTEITYRGTSDEWREVRNHNSINAGCPIRKIICSDKTIEL